MSFSPIQIGHLQKVLVRLLARKGCSIPSIHFSRILFLLLAGEAGNQITGLGSFGPFTRAGKSPIDKANENANGPSQLEEPSYLDPSFSARLHSQTAIRGVGHMEILTFGLIAARKGYIQHTTLVPEAARFLPFNLKSLSPSYRALDDLPNLFSLPKKWVDS